VIRGDAVASGVAAKEGWGSGVEVGVIRGDAVASGVAVGAGAGVLAGWAPGAVGCCSQATTAQLIKAMGTMRYLFMPINTDATPPRIFKSGRKGPNFKHYARRKAFLRVYRDRSVWLRILNPSPARTDQPHSWSSRCSAIADRPCGRMRIG
jgi:hypothetical protein